MTEGRQTYISLGDAADKAPGLDHDLKLSYAAALYYFARIGEVTEHEERVIQEVARGQGIDAETLEVARHAELDSERLGELLGRVNGAYLVRDALRVAHADGDFEEDEQRVAAQLADAIGITAERLERIKIWVDRELKQRADWVEILGSR